MNCPRCVTIYTLYSSIDYIYGNTSLKTKYSEINMNINHFNLSFRKISTSKNESTKKNIERGCGGGRGGQVARMTHYTRWLTWRRIRHFLLVGRTVGKIRSLDFADWLLDFGSFRSVRFC